MITRRRRPAESGESYLASLSDLMVGMLFVFIIMLMAFALNFREAQTTSEAKQQNAEREIADLSKTKEKAEADLNETKEKALKEIARLRHEAEQEIESLRGELDGRSTKLTGAVQVLDRFQAELRDAGILRGQMLERIRRTLRERHAIEVLIDSEAGVLRLGDRLLFDTGKDTLREKATDQQFDGQQVISLLGKVLQEVLPCYTAAEKQIGCPPSSRAILEAVYVEGHTDNVRFEGRAKEGNWELSTRRAVTTYVALIDSQPSLRDLRNASGMPLFGVSGYGEERPAADNQTDSGKARNRRIDLRFVLATPDSQKLDAMSKEIRERAGIDK
jgi:chemotaxis protein MotB